MSAVTQLMITSSNAIHNGMTVLSRHDHSEADCTTVAGQSPGPMSMMKIGSKQAGMRGDYCDEGCQQGTQAMLANTLCQLIQVADWYAVLTGCLY